MTSSQYHTNLSLAEDIGELIAKLLEYQHGTLVERALSVLLRITREEIDRLYWKI